MALQCRSAGAMSPRLFRGFLVPLVLLVRRHVLGEFQAGNRAIAAGAPRLGRAGASFRTRRPPPACSLCFHLLPRWLRAAPTVDAASERRLLRDRPPLAPLCVSLRCLAACAPRPCSRQEGRSSGPTLALSEARAECYSRAQRSTTLARFGGALGEGGMPLSACPRPAHRPLGAADRRAPAVHANALALLTQRVSAPRRQRRAFACARWLL